jgi:hypothetical protein
MSRRFAFGERFSFAVMALIGVGTFGALAITSAAKKAGAIQRPTRPAWPGDAGSAAGFDARIKALEERPPE